MKSRCLLVVFPPLKAPRERPSCLSRLLMLPDCNLCSIFTWLPLLFLPSLLSSGPWPLRWGLPAPRTPPSETLAFPTAADSLSALVKVPLRRPSVSVLSEGPRG